jgi:DNA polymerase-3 subunit epsilon
MRKLRKWLEEPPSDKGGTRTYSLPRETRLSLPELPGVYRFFGADGKLLYIGKATSLRHRVSSYFTKRKADEKTLELVTQVHDLRITPCGSPLEAALLECRLIRRLKPPYNRAMKSGDENLWFCSKNRSVWGNNPARGHGVGPFVTRDAHDRLAVLNDIVSGRISPEDTEIVSMFHLERAEFEPGALEEGIAALRDYLTIDGRFYMLQGLLRLGRDLWLEMLEKRERPGEEEEDNGTGEEETEEPRKLCSGDVFSILRWTVADVAVHERRLRWFRLLAWSTVAWKPPADESGELRFIVLRNGRVVRSGRRSPDGVVPPPLDRSIPVLSRTGYETLRVLTGELRRILAAGSEIRLLLPTGCTLEGESLARLLRMV